MNYKAINKNAFDVPDFRLSLSLPIIFLSFSLFGVIFVFATEGKTAGNIYPIAIVIGIITILLLIVQFRKILQTVLLKFGLVRLDHILLDIV